MNSALRLIFALMILVAATTANAGAAATFKPDRRPIQMIWTGPEQWTSEQVSSILPVLVKGESLAGSDPRGPRFMIHHPASWTKEAPTHNMAQFWPLPKATRAAYAKVIIEARKGRKFTLGISCHMLMVDPFTQAGPSRYYDHRDPADHYAMWGLIIEPWHKLLGAGSLAGPGLHDWCFEGGSTMEAWPKALAFGTWLRDNQNIHPLVEGVQGKMVDGAFVVDVERCQQMAGWCLAKEFADNPNLLGDESVNECPEVHALLVGTPQNPLVNQPTYNVDQIVSLLKRGWIVGGDRAHWARIKQAMSLMEPAAP